VLVGGSPAGGLVRAYQARPVTVVSQQLRPFLTRWNRQDLNLLKELAEAGKLTPVIDRAYPLNEAAGAAD